MKPTQTQLHLPISAFSANSLEKFSIHFGLIELVSLTSQFAMSKSRRGGQRNPPYAFTEHGKKSLQDTFEPGIKCNQ